MMRHCQQVVLAETLPPALVPPSVRSTTVVRRERVAVDVEVPVDVETPAAVDVTLIVTLELADRTP